MSSFHVGFLERSPGEREKEGGGSLWAGTRSPLGRCSAARGKSRPWRESLKNIGRSWKGRWSETGGLSPRAACPLLWDFVRPSISGFPHPQVWNHISRHVQSRSQCPSWSLTSPRSNSGDKFLLYRSPGELVQGLWVTMTGTGDVQWQEERVQWPGAGPVSAGMSWPELCLEDTVFFEEATIFFKSYIKIVVWYCVTNALQLPSLSPPSSASFNSLVLPG